MIELGLVAASDTESFLLGHDPYATKCNWHLVGPRWVSFVYVLSDRPKLFFRQMLSPIGNFLELFTRNALKLFDDNCLLLITGRLKNLQQCLWVA